MPAPAKISDLLDRYDAFLVDAYGVLNDAAGALPGAAALIGAIDRRARPWLLLTNDASRLPAVIARRLTDFGVPVGEEHVLCSAQLIAPWFAANHLEGRPTTVLGTDDSRAMVAAAGGAIVEPGEPTEIVIAADDAGYPFLDAIEATINASVRALDAGVDLRLLLPNPDLVYPRPDGVGLTSGAVAILIEAILGRLRPGAPRFVGLGKPHLPIYEEARRRLGPLRLLAIGDSLDTDVAGAVAAGIDVALIESAVGRWRPGMSPEPTYLLDSIEV